MLMGDHKPMVNLDKIHKGTLLQLQQLMGEYNFQNDFLPSSKNVITDALCQGAVCSSDPAATVINVLDNRML